MLFLKVLKPHLWPKTQHKKLTLLIFGVLFTVLFLCCSHTSSHIPEDGVNVMVITCILVSMSISRCQSFLPWDFALAQPWSQEVLWDEWIRMHKSKQISCFFVCSGESGSYSFLFSCATLTFLSAVACRYFNAVNYTASDSYCVRNSFSLPF